MVDYWEHLIGLGSRVWVYRVRASSIRLEDRVYQLKKKKLELRGKLPWVGLLVGQFNY